VKAFSANLSLLGLGAILALMEVVPYELVWLSFFLVPDALRKLFKLNTEAVSLVLHELDFWVPFVTLCLGAFFGSASFGHEGAAVHSFFAVVLTYTVNILLGKLPNPFQYIHMRSTLTCGMLTDLTRTLSPAADADLAARVIRNKSAATLKFIVILLGVAAFTILMTFGLFPRSINHKYHFHFIYNQGSIEVVSMFTRFLATPLLFLCKFVVKSLVYKGRTVIIKIPLVRHVMPKRELWGFLRRHAEGQSSNRAALRMSLRTASGSVSAGKPTSSTPQVAVR
jgi:hypothetical protein